MIGAGLSALAGGGRSCMSNPRREAAILAAIGFKHATRVDALLSDLCVSYGFCLTPEDQEALVGNPPGDLKSFVDAILIAEGYDPILCDKQVRRWISDAVREWVFDEGLGKGTASGLPLRRT